MVSAESMYRWTASKATVACQLTVQLDSDEQIGHKTVDPQLLAGNNSNLTLRSMTSFLPAYQGMPHPPSSSGNLQCDSMPWSAPFVPSYQANSRGSSLNLTMCNWYLPQGPGVQGIHRCSTGWLPGASGWAPAALCNFHVMTLLMGPSHLVLTPPLFVSHSVVHCLWADLAMACCGQRCVAQVM